ncbi:hypothetical protein [Clostridium frigidicarnis]|uniref:Uncharacterized protein n=1 Tax=Clostridium frigidicarnis TaxID=84698 RepID=A0A1I0XFN9_9CLOT|nr:hypothetical protein [Clostridium frigidicarnis]SFA99801.1 hypothetical protein SAMN04488528_100882 [Clostridium frigidicarnis]
MRKENLENTQNEILKLDFIDNEIGEIINKGIKPKITFFQYIKNMYTELGFKVIFHDIKELLILTAIIIVFILNISANIVSIEQIRIEQVYGVMFCTSPLIYLGNSFYSFFKTKQSGTFELELTCKYNIYQLASLRMFAFSIVTVLINTGLIIMLFFLNREINILRAWGISVSSVFLFSSLLLYIATKIKNRISKYIVVAMWIIANLWINLFHKELAIIIFLKLPMVVHLGITLICTILYIKSLKKLTYIRSNKGEI